MLIKTHVNNCEKTSSAGSATLGDTSWARLNQTGAK